MSEMLSVADPLFVSVADRVMLVVSIRWMRKFSEVGSSATATLTPVPDREAVWVPVDASSLTVSFPVRDPSDPGVKVTEIVHAFPAPKDEPQSLLCLKSPLAEMLAIVSVAFPVLVSLTPVAVLLTSTAQPPKERLEAPSLAPGTAPVPESGMEVSPADAFVDTFKVPVLPPVLVGLNTTEIVQLEPTPNEEPHVLEEMANGPSAETLSIVMDPELLPLLLSVAFFAELVVPTLTLPKASPPAGASVAVALAASAGGAIAASAKSSTQDVAARANPPARFFILPHDPRVSVRDVRLPAQLTGL
jgi:hypothetical protein